MPEPLNFVLITLDSVIAAHLGCYGYPGVDTPVMDRLAHDGVLFENAFCQAPNTWISHASLFSGSYPNRHGLRSYLSGLRHDVPLLAEELKNRGYATAGFPAHSLVGKARGFERGFDLFDEEDLLFASYMVEGLRQNRAWQPTLAKAFSWINNTQQPFFLWLHYMGTHWEPPESLTVPEDVRRRYSPLGQYHDAKISYADEVCVGAVWDFLAHHNLLEDTMLVVTADHGEEDLLKNDPPFINQAHNNRLNDQVMRVPLLIRAPGYIPAGTKVSTVVRLIDIMPTLLCVAGNKPTSLPVDGLDLRVFWDDDAAAPPVLKAYMENLNRGYAGVRTDQWKLVLRVGPKPVQASIGQRIGRRLQRMLRNGDMLPQSRPMDENPRYENWINLHTEGLYSIADDPQENRDLSRDQKSVEIYRTLEKFVMDMVHWQRERNQKLSADDEQQILATLEGLGYLE
jgi:arylsulfatase